MSGNMQWVRVNGELTISERMSSGYAYRVREHSDGSALLIAEGPISGGNLPTRREECVSRSAALRLADQWESVVKP